MNLLAAACLALGAVGMCMVGHGAPLPSSQLLAFTPTEKAQILALGPWPPKLRDDASNAYMRRTSVQKLGSILFFDKGLSATGDLSCASCHQPQRGFQDGLSTAQGRTTGHRNTPGLLDAAQWRWFSWDGAHDSLWAASLAPLLSESEMNRTVSALAQYARTSDVVRSAYREAFQSMVPADDTTLVVNLAKALAAYQSTLVSPRTSFDTFRDSLAKGHRKQAGRYPLPAQRGLKIFLGEGRCTFCHTGPNFTNGEFADVGIAFFVPGGVDAGRYKGIEKLLASPYNRLGTYNDAGSKDPGAVSTRHVNLQARHFGEFRVPTLRQLTHTAPYMHNGSLVRLKDVIGHYSNLPMDRLHSDGEQILRPLHLTDQQEADLLAFLVSLSR